MGCSHNGAHAQDAVQQLEAILEDSAASMGAQHSAPAGGSGQQLGQAVAASMSVSSKAQKTAWWRARLGLDERLRALLQHLDASRLGPWRCALHRIAGVGIF